MPTPAELAAMPYGGVARTAMSLDAAGFRTEYQQHGETVRWWKGYLTATGARNFVEQTLADTVRVMVYNSRREFEDAEFGLIAKGTTMISVLPDEIEACHGDRFCLTHAKRAKLRRGHFIRQGSIDPLPYSPVASIARVVNASGTVLVLGTDYAVASGGAGIEFLTNSVAVGASYAIDWRAYSTFEVLTGGERDSPIGADNLQLPVAWAVTPKRNTSDG